MPRNLKDFGSKARKKILLKGKTVKTKKKKDGTGGKRIRIPVISVPGTGTKELRLMPGTGAGLGTFMGGIPVKIGKGERDLRARPILIEKVHKRVSCLKSKQRKLLTHRRSPSPFSHHWARAEGRSPNLP